MNQSTKENFSPEPQPNSEQNADDISVSPSTANATLAAGRLIEGYPAYPIYKFNFRWSQDGVQDEKYPKWHEGLPEGRTWNGTGFNKMFKEEKTQEWLNAYAANWWANYIIKQQQDSKIKNPELVKIEAVFSEYETWYLTWFQHETFDIAQTDDEALRSFETFVTRKEILNERQQVIDGNDAYCLMGAEDRYRWHGAEPNGDKNDYSPAPCRCKFCKEQDVIRIAH